jgi:hypothetical protein
MIVKESIIARKSKLSYVYMITNNILGLQYIGSRICYKEDIDKDGYYGSSKYLNDDIIKYGKENFTKKILQVYLNISSSELLDEETKYILEYNTLLPNGYNRFIPNKAKGFYGGMTGKHHSERSREIMRKPHTFSEESKKSLKEPKSEQHKQHMKDNHADVSGSKNPMFGKSIYNTWVKKYGEEKANIKMKQSFKPLPTERKTQISNSLKGRFKGKESPRFGKSIYSIWVEKYGEEKAQEMWNKLNLKRSKTSKNK